MSNVYGKAAQENPERVADGRSIPLRATRDGSLMLCDWFTTLALEGKCFGTNNGTASGAITFEEASAVSEEDLFLHVPASVVVIPLHINFALEDTGGLQTVWDVVAAVSSTGDAAVTGTGLTIRNMRTDLAGTLSACTATGVVTSNGTDTSAGNYYEFWRPDAGKFIDSFNTTVAPVSPLSYSWSMKNHSTVPPIIAGGGSLSAWFGGSTAVIGFCSLVWAELPSGAV